MQAHARPPAGAVGGLGGTAGEGEGRRHDDIHIDPREPLQRVTQHAGLQLALVRERDMAELRAAGALVRGDGDVGGRPDVRLPIRRCVEHLDRVGAPEGCLPHIREPGAHALPRQRVGDEDDTSLMPCHEDPAVRDVVDLQFRSRRPHPPSEHPTAAPITWGVRVCLASTSPARLQLLRQAGIEPETIGPDVDEEAVVASVEASEGRRLSAPEHVLLLARRKAADVVARLKDDDPAFDGIVIGGDSMFELGGAILGKPLDPHVAAARWATMRGRTGVLHSGHAVVRVRPGTPDAEAHATAEASVSFVADMTDAEIAAYVATGEPLGVAGAFTVDSRGGAFIERVEGDPSTVVGMSLSTVRRLCHDLGIRWTDLWDRS